MASFNFDTWWTATKLTETSVDILKKEDLDTEEALQLLTPTDLEKLGLSIGQKRVLEAALKKLRKDVNEKPSPGDATGASDPITTKSLASDGGLEEILKKIESAGSLDESLLALGSTDFSSAKPPALNTSTLPRLDNDPHVFLGLQQKGTSAKQGEKPLLIPDFVNLGTYDNREDQQEIGNNSSGAKIVIRSARGKPKLEHVTLSMSVGTNSQIMHELLWTGKLSATTTTITASNPIHSPRLWRMITSIVNYSANMAFYGGATCNTFIPDFWLNTVLCRPQLQPRPAHRDFPHALTANHKPHPQLQFATNNLIR